METNIFTDTVRSESIQEISSKDVTDIVKVTSGSNLYAADVIDDLYKAQGTKPARFRHPL